MLPEDSLDAALPSIQSLHDRRIRHFYDPDQRAGREVATCLKWEGYIAWDIYLFYAPGRTWTDTPPEPDFWMHQMSADWAQNSHFKTGDSLKRGLSEALAALIDRC